MQNKEKEGKNEPQKTTINIVVYFLLVLFPCTEMFFFQKDSWDYSTYTIQLFFPWLHIILQAFNHPVNNSL